MNLGSGVVEKEVMEGGWNQSNINYSTTETVSKGFGDCLKYEITQVMHL